MRTTNTGIANFQLTLSFTPVPEPSALALLAVGLGPVIGAASALRRRQPRARR